MTLPRRSIDTQKQTTMFGELSAIEKQTSFIKQQLQNNIQTIIKCKNDFKQIQNQALAAERQFQVKVNQEISNFQQKVKNYLIAQKAQYMRFSTQINQMIVTSKELNSQLTILANRFQIFSKNVGL